MNLTRYSKTIFTFASVMNILAALSALGAMNLHIQMFYGAAQIDVLHKFYHYNFWFVVLVMGASYYAIALKPVQNRVLMLVGAAGKLMAASSWVVMYALGIATWLVWGGIVYDGIFGVLFLMLYRQTPSNQAL